MATTRKIISKLAFRLQAGKTIGAGVGWGTDAQIQTLGANSQMAFTSFTGNGKTESANDESFAGVAFMDLPVQTGRSAEGAINGDLRYRGLDKWLFWALGWERPGNSPLTNCQFTVSSCSVTAGATYTNNSSTFTVRNTLASSAGTLYTTRTSGSNAPSGDTLTKASGTGDATITFTANTGIYYSHLYELDARDRHVASYRSTPAEQTAGDYASTDRKNRLATIGFSRGTTDFRYPHAMCTRFGLSSSAGALAKFTSDFTAYTETRADYSSADWTMMTDGAGSAYNIPHHQWQCQIGAYAGLADVGITDFDIGVEIPISFIQDTESGLYFTEPVGEGKYNITTSITLSRHTADTVLAARDAFTTYNMSLIATSSADQFKILLPNLKIKDSPVGDEDVPKVKVDFEIAYQTSAATPFTGVQLEGHTIIQESPILIIANNQNSTNEMRRE